MRQVRSKCQQLKIQSAENFQAVKSSRKNFILARKNIEDEGWVML
jgi:hypothetical protein